MKTNDNIANNNKQIISTPEPINLKMTSNWSEIARKVNELIGNEINKKNHQ